MLLESGHLNVLTRVSLQWTNTCHVPARTTRMETSVPALYNVERRNLDVKMAALEHLTNLARSPVDAPTVTMETYVNILTRASKRNATTAPSAGILRRRLSNALVRTATLAPPASTFILARITLATTAPPVVTYRIPRTSVCAITVTTVTTARALNRVRPCHVRTMPHAGTLTMRSISASVVLAL